MKSLKGKPITSNWKKNVRKQKRATGEEHLSAQNKLVERKEIREPCQAITKCTKNISAEDRATIYSNYWSSDLQNEQKGQFVAGSIEE